MIVTMVVMGEPRTTTVDKLTASDIGHVVRFLPTDSRREVNSYLEAVLLDFWTEPKGYRFKLRFPAAYAYHFRVGENESYGPVKPWQQIEVLGLPGPVVIGDQAPAGLEARLDPALRDALSALRQQGDR